MRPTIAFIFLLSKSDEFFCPLFSCRNLKKDYQLIFRVTQYLDASVREQTKHDFKTSEFWEMEEGGGKGCQRLLAELCTLIRRSERNQKVALFTLNKAVSKTDDRVHCLARISPKQDQKSYFIGHTFLRNAKQ